MNSENNTTLHSSSLKTMDGNTIEPATKYILLTALFWVAILPLADQAEAQIPRERAEVDEPIDNIFWASTNIGLRTVRAESAGSLNSTVKHTFGLVEGGIDSFFGLDDGANTRLGVEYGFSERFTAGLGRMTFRNVVDIHGQYNILRQTTTDSMPIELALYASTGIETLEGTGQSFSERLSYLTSLMVARKFNSLSVQLSPTLGTFNNVTDGNQDQFFGLGVSANYVLNDRLALSAEYLPVLSESNPGTHNSFGVALNIDTGGHIFQIFFTGSQWHNEQYIMANNRDSFWEGEFRFGFNIHRVFALR